MQIETTPAASEGEPDSKVPRPSHIINVIHAHFSACNIEKLGMRLGKAHYILRMAPVTIYNRPKIDTRGRHKTPQVFYLIYKDPVIQGLGIY